MPHIWAEEPIIPNDQWLNNESVQKAFLAEANIRWELSTSGWDMEWFLKNYYHGTWRENEFPNLEKYIEHMSDDEYKQFAWSYGIKLEILLTAAETRFKDRGLWEQEINTKELREAYNNCIIDILYTLCEDYAQEYIEYIYSLHHNRIQSQ